MYSWRPREFSGSPRFRFASDKQKGLIPDAVSDLKFYIASSSDEAYSKTILTAATIGATTNIALASLSLSENIQPLNFLDANTSELD